MLCLHGPFIYLDVRCLNILHVYSWIVPHTQRHNPRMCTTSQFIAIVQWDTVTQYTSPIYLELMPIEETACAVDLL